jgi:hypothetical protein
MDLSMALIRCQPTCFLSIRVKQTVISRTGVRPFYLTISDGRSLKLIVSAASSDLTTQPAKPYHVMFEKEAFSCL